MHKLKKIAHWISSNYSSADKVIEVGVGETPTVLEELCRKLSRCNLLATDIEEKHVPENVEFYLDDIQDPDRAIYQDADLIYSIRLPTELYRPLREIADEVEADILIKPASSEESPHWGNLINYLGVAFYLRPFSP